MSPTPSDPQNRPDNWLRAVRFETPDHVPVACNINTSCWHHYSKRFLWEMVESHPTVFPWFKSADPAERERIANPVFRVDSRADTPYRDPWGCLWQTLDDGIVGAVVDHPLRDWKALAGFTAPDPDRTDGMFSLDWAAMATRRQSAAAAGRTFMVGLPHGHTFLRLCDLRGYEDLLFDMTDDRAELHVLVDQVRSFNLAVLDRLLRLEPDAVSIPEDLGMQTGPMLSPDHFETWIAPCYREYVRRVRTASGALVHMHSDGDIRMLAGTLLEIGMDILNLQDLVNGLDWIEAHLKGKVCIDLDIDRQRITRFGTPAQIDALIGESVSRLGSKAGGLTMIFGLYPGLPEANVEATLDAMETHAFHF